MVMALTKIKVLPYTNQEQQNEQLTQQMEIDQNNQHKKSSQFQQMQSQQQQQNHFQRNNTSLEETEIANTNYNQNILSSPKPKKSIDKLYSTSSTSGSPVNHQNPNIISFSTPKTAAHNQHNVNTISIQNTQPQKNQRKQQELNSGSKSTFQSKHSNQQSKGVEHEIKNINNGTEQENQVKKNKWIQEYISNDQVKQLLIDDYQGTAKSRKNSNDQHGSSHQQMQLQKRFEGVYNLELFTKKNPAEKILESISLKNEQQQLQQQQQSNIMNSSDKNQESGESNIQQGENQVQNEKISIDCQEQILEHNIKETDKDNEDGEIIEQLEQNQKQKMVESGEINSEQEIKDNNQEQIDQVQKMEESKQEKQSQDEKIEQENNEQKSQIPKQNLYLMIENWRSLSNFTEMLIKYLDINNLKKLNMPYKLQKALQQLVQLIKKLAIKPQPPSSIQQEGNTQEQEQQSPQPKEIQYYYKAPHLRLLFFTLSSNIQEASASFMEQDKLFHKEVFNLDFAAKNQKSYKTDIIYINFIKRCFYEITINHVRQEILNQKENFINLNLAINESQDPQSFGRDKNEQLDQEEIEREFERIKGKFISVDRLIAGQSTTLY